MARYVGAATAVVLFGALSTSAQAQSATDYSYDVHGRLVGSSRSDTATTYTYDNAGNRIRLVTTGGNHPPVANTDNASVSPGSTISISALSNDQDADSDALTITEVSAAVQGTRVITNGGLNISYTANSNASGTETLTYKIVDSKGAPATGQIVITINSATAPPTVGAATTTITANTANNPLSMSITGSATSVAISTPPASSNGSANVSGTQIYFTPVTNWSGVSTLSYTASNAGGTSAPAQLTVQVKPTVNPVSNVAVTYNTARSISLSPITNYSALSIDGAPSKGTVTISGATATYSPYSGQTGADSFSYRATTAGVAGDPQTVSLNISTPPTGPVANNDNITVPYQSAALFQPKNNDSGMGLSITAATQPSVGRTAFDADNIWVGDMGEGGFNTSFQYTITDSLGRTSTATVNVTAAGNPVPAPVAQNDAISIPYGGSLTFQPLDNDSGTGLQIVNVTAPSIGNFAYDGGNIWYGIDPGWSGTTSMQYTIRDSFNRTSTATVYVTVQPNTAPVANPDQVIVPYGGAVLFQPMSNDTGNLITIQSVSTPAGVNMSHDAGNIWLGSTGWSGSGTFTYTIVDNLGRTATSTVTYTALGSGEIEP
jgi:YD repeat-containing protein